MPDVNSRPGARRPGKSQGLSRGHHDWASEAYVDSWLAAAQGRQASQRGLHFGIMRGLLPFSAGAAFRFLDVGCGAGALASSVLEAFPNSWAVCLDGSPVMLARARNALAAYGRRVEGFVQSDLSRRGWSKELAPASFDAVVSYQAIHNLFDAAAIRRVYRGIAGVLKPSGVFVTVDEIDANPLLREQVEAAHAARRLARNGGQVPAGDPATSLGRFAGTLEEHFRWLRRAGFRAADCPWRELYQSMLIARK